MFSAKPVLTERMLSITAQPRTPAVIQPHRTRAASRGSFRAASVAPARVRHQPSVTGPITASEKRRCAVMSSGSPPPRIVSNNRVGPAVASMAPRVMINPNIPTERHHNLIQFSQIPLISPVSCFHHHSSTGAARRQSLSPMKLCAIGVVKGRRRNDCAFHGDIRRPKEPSLRARAGSGGKAEVPAQGRDSAGGVMSFRGVCREGHRL